LRHTVVRTVAALSLVCLAANAQVSRRVPAIAQPLDESELIRLPGNVRPEANRHNDRGPVDASLPLDHLLLQLKRLPGTEAAVQKFLDSQQDPRSPNFHQWLTAAQFGERFGTVPQDLGIVTRWLGSHGFVVNQVHPNRMLIDFSGTAGQVREAFHTEIHNLEVNRTIHIANMSDPRIPAALAPVLAGVVSLHDFRPRPLSVPRSNYTVGTTLEPVVPGDLATIYNFNPAYTAGYTGTGQTVVVIEDSDVYSTNDFTTFRSTFGLASQYPSGSLTQVHPTGGPGGACTDPGATADDAEAEIDAEWASAAAPNATIELASCADTQTNFGGFIALQNLLAEATPPSIVSISYGESEAANGAAGNLYVYDLYQTAVAEGVSVFVSAGDEGAASSDAGSNSATQGITVSALATTPYNVALGGTDFADTYAKTNTNYWSSTNGADYNSALSYIPEIPWNNSCASELIAMSHGYATTYGAGGFCASGTAQSDGSLTLVAASGGPSNCATGNPTDPGVAGGTCQGYPKPSWQSVYGNPADGVRDIPDVSLFAANGIWGHYYVTCFSDPGRNRGGAPCTGSPSSWAGYGGTSFSSPVMAGVQALINQRMGARQGNPNYQLYSLAQAEYGNTGNAACNSSSSAGTCVFNDVTLGDMDVNCTAGSPDCFDPASATDGGVLSTSTSSYAPAYGTASGWDFATGIGTVNVYLLVTSWSSTAPQSPQTITFNPLSNVALGVAPFSITATASSRLPVSFASNTTAVCTVSGSTVTILTVGTCSITATQPGNSTWLAATPVTQTFAVTTPLPVLLTPANGATGVSTSPTLTWTSATGATSYDVYFGTSPTPSKVTNTSGTSYAPATLGTGTMYYWYIVARSTSGTVASGSPWSFTTTAPVAPAAPVLSFPANGASGVSMVPSLSWSVSSGATSYTVYFGASSTSPSAIDTTATSYSPGALLGNTTYLWQVIANNAGGSSPSPIWSFKTATSPSKVGIFRDGFFWLLDADGNRQWDDPPDQAFAYGGIAGDIPIAGDWNGDGHTKVGIYRAKNGDFLLDTNGNDVFDAGDAVYKFLQNVGGPQPGDVPVVGDWNGSGTSKIGIVRDGFLWLLDLNGNGIYEPGTDLQYVFGGAPGDVPVVGDWTGTGTTKIGVLRGGFLWLLDANGNGTWDGAAGGDYAFAFGAPGDVPVVGDWTGDGVSKVGMFRDGFLWVLDSDDPAMTNATGQAPLIVFAFGGVAGDVPIVGKWFAPPASITAVGGTPQSTPIHSAFPTPLSLFVTGVDGYGVSGVTLQFTAPASGASAVFTGGASTATTNAAGAATSALPSANGTTGGPYSVTASVMSCGTYPGCTTVAPSNFSLTNTAAPALTPSHPAKSK